MEPVERPDTSTASLALLLVSPSTATTSSIERDAESSSSNKQVKKARRKWKKPKGKPKRPLSAYNLYFKAERKRMLRRGKKQKLGFRDMAKIIGAKWNTLGPRQRVTYQKSANEERKVYFEALAVWKREQKQTTEAEEDCFHREMERYSEMVSEYSDMDAMPTPEPLPIARQVTPSFDDVFSETNIAVPDFTKSNDYLAKSLQVAADLSTDILSELDDTYPSEEDLLGSGSQDNDDDAYHHSPAMQRILSSFKELESSIDDEFVDFMSTLDFNGTSATSLGGHRC